jgi:hypothetical protein
MRDSSYLPLKRVLEALESRSAGRRLPQQVEDAFFSAIRVGNHIAKKTYARRLDGINEVANRLLPKFRPLRIMDVGISSGVSTLEWVESLENKRIDYHLDAVDLMVRGMLIEMPRGVDVLADVAGRPLLIDLNGKWIPFPPGKRDLIRHFFKILIIRGALYLAAPEVSHSEANGKAASKGRWFNASKAPLVYSELMHHTRVTVTEGNLLDPATLPARLHVVRAANILNRSYFSDDQLLAIVQNLRATLCESGLLVICKTDDSGRTEGTVFVLKDNGSFEILETINGGSEIEDLVCSEKAVGVSG